MLRYLLLVSICQGIYSHFTDYSRGYMTAIVTKQPSPNGLPNWPTAARIDVTLMAIYKKDERYIEEDFLKMFSDFGQKNHIHFNDRNFQRMDNRNDGLMATYGLRGVPCLQLQKFLLEIKSYDYNIKHVNVTCDRLKFSVCLTFSCPDNYDINTWTPQKR
ncbi:hypothetical protein RB195_012178 [Necator americanus]|uniref:Uncharacterized protein n=1 Tax=Necator americanus TaxID=51031 RepID=A0ABR1D7G9_NECAM